MHLFQRVALLMVFSHVNNAAWWGGGGSKCSDGKKRCEWLNWEEWESCSHTCGGGIKYRNRKGLCCKTDWSYEKCLSECGKSRSDSYETTECNSHCFNGGTYSNGCTCPYDKYGYCCENSCPAIAHCSKVRCSTISDNICTECMVQGVDKNSSLYWPIYWKKKCEATCSYDGRWCWPGSCKNSMYNEMDGLAPSCKCHRDFKKYSISDAKCERDGSTPDNTVREGRMYARRGDLMCPVASFKKYFRKFHPQVDMLWQRPYEEDQSVWFYKMPMGKNALDR